MSSSRKSSHNTDDKLVYMANQIGTFFKSQDKDTASAQIADHITKFWDPRMRKAIVAYVEAGNAGLDSAAQQAVEKLRPKPATALTAPLRPAPERECEPMRSEAANPTHAEPSRDRMDLAARPRMGIWLPLTLVILAIAGISMLIATGRVDVARIVGLLG